MSYIFTDEVGFKDTAVDAFNRLKVVNPFTVFDSQHRYQENYRWSTFGISGGTYSYSVEESAVNLIVGTTSGSKVTRETKRVFPYQPGKSLLVLGTFAFNQPKEGLRQRIGYFGITGGATSGIPYNGIYLEQNGLTLSMNLVSASLGTTTTVNQSDWNGDVFDGTGASGRDVDICKANIFWMDIEWLGVGDVRTGFFVHGKPVIAHTFHNDNINPTTYMTTACLPIRYELENLTGQTGSSQAKQICSSVISDGGYEGFSRRYNVSTGTTEVNLSSSGVYYPILSIRLNSNRLDSIIVPSNISTIVTTNSWVNYRVVLNGTFTGTTPTWQTHFNGNVDYAIFDGSSGLTGSTDILGGYINVGGAVSIGGVNDFNFQLGRTQTGESDVLTIVAAGPSPNSKVVVDLSWFEII